MAAVSTVLSTVGVLAGGYFAGRAIQDGKTAKAAAERQQRIQSKAQTQQLEELENRRKKDEEARKRIAAGSVSSRPKNTSQAGSNRTILTSPLGTPAPTTTSGRTTLLGS